MALNQTRRDFISGIAGAATATLVRAPRAAPAEETLETTTVRLEKDPGILAKGYVASLSHPGGNLTGVVFQQLELIAKRLDLLTQAVPHIARIVLLYDAASV